MSFHLDAKTHDGVEIWSQKFLGVWIEHHRGACTCSHCGDGYLGPLSFGLNIPPAWSAWNAWYTIKYGKGKYIRWTNHWFKWFERRETS